ncbi:MAG: ATPase domain-containing protein [Methanosarcinales archaeon]
MERLSTGIIELDDLIEGYPKGKSILISGNAGTGKTILALHFLTTCCKNGMKCLYIATEETPEDLKVQASSLNWNLEEYEKKGLLKIVRVLEQRSIETEFAVSAQLKESQKDLIHLTDEVTKEIDVVVIDNIGVFAIGMSVEQIRDQLDTLIFRLCELGCTSILICDEATGKITNDIAMYSVYGAIKLLRRDNPYTGERERVIDIIKMRSTKTPIDYILYDITNEGIKLQSQEVTV